MDSDSCLNGPDKSLEYQEHYEQIFNCPVCLCPKLRMVYGTCQHKLCDDCIYDNDGYRKTALDRCPVCMADEAFPQFKPDIPRDNELAMHQVGVRKCKHVGCNEQFWYWEMEAHELTHNKEKEVPKSSKCRKKENKAVAKSAKVTKSKDKKRTGMKKRLAQLKLDVRDFLGERTTRSQSGLLIID